MIDLNFILTTKNDILNARKSVRKIYDRGFNLLCVLYNKNRSQLLTREIVRVLLIPGLDDPAETLAIHS